MADAIDQPPPAQGSPQAEPAPRQAGAAGAQRGEAERSSHEPAERSQEEEGFEAWILGSMTSGIVGIDSEAAVVTFNAGAQRILGCPKGDLAEAIGRDCREVLADEPGVARLLIETLERHSSLSRAELVLESGRNRLGSTIGFTLSPVRDAQGRLRGAAMIFRDLTPIERSDEQERLRERLAALGQMAAGLAHEIRNPLAGMEVLAGLLKRRLADRPDDQALVAELTGELRTLADTVTASLDFVRPVAPEHGPVDAERLLEDALALARRRVPFGGTVVRDGDASLPALSADEDQLRTVLTNLIVNALESMATGEGAADPCLALGLRVREGESAVADAGVAPRELEITITDNGPGVASELREKVFYPFFSTKQGGSGVGLASAQKIVASHGGSLELESDRGQGCTFRIRLPVDSGAAR
jgi:PAS domain S-box-containing protein